MVVDPGPSSRPRRRRRRCAMVLGLLLGLLTTGTAYAVLVPAPQRVSAEAPLIERGEELYRRSCLTCHGSALQGVPDRGPSLIGVGEAATYFQVSTGRMPLARSTAQAERKPPPPEFDPGTEEGRRNLAALGAYVQAHGGGPRRPEGSGAALVGTDTARGGKLFRSNCSQCHNFTGRGGVLAAGKFAPNLHDATPEQLYTAMLTGPQAMPVFSDRELSPGEKADIIAYVLEVRGQHNAPGGFNLGEWGPTTEGFVVFLLGVPALIGVALWLGARA
ncbi:cytochrome bc1 complex diheme cytochrome c subunit [Saccharopolyspora sp. CA-218241]|uniref:cytochrome bc1 complex diheme cytochrome c subunit n=1 Tax=Saccharopolyspora sp. CA-218241 TaxID=3240027 RepID=UPI003D966882